MRRQALYICTILVMVFGLVFHNPAFGQAGLPGTLPEVDPKPVWYTVISDGPQEGFSTPDQACRRQHQSFNPGATYESPEYLGPWLYNCRWQAVQFGGPPGSNTILPSIVFRACPYEYVGTRNNTCVRPLDNEAELDCKEKSQAASLVPAPQQGNPTCITSGAKVEFANDYQTADGLFRVDRHYRSRQHQPQQYSRSPIPGFGPNWHGALPGRIAVYGNYTEVFEYLSATGGVEYFSTHDLWNQNSYRFYSIGGGRRTLEAVAVPSVTRESYFRTQDAVFDGPAEFKLIEADGSFTLYRRSGSWSARDEVRYLVPIAQVSQGGYTQYFDYPDTGDFPNMLRDSFGRQMQLSWAETKLRTSIPGGNNTSVDLDDGLELKVITQIILPDATRLVYSYGDAARPDSAGRADRLDRVSRNDSAGNVLWARAYLYENDALPYALTGMVDQNGNRLSTYSYHPFGLVKSTERAGGLGRIEIDYSVDATWEDTTKYRVVKNPLGHEEVYKFWRWSIYSPPIMPSALLEKTGRASATVPADSMTIGYEWSHLHFAVLMQSEMIDALGVKTLFANDHDKRRATTIDEAVGTPVARATDLQWHPTLDLATQADVPGLRTQLSYGATGQVLSRTLTDTTTHAQPYATSGQSRTETYSWSASGRLLSINGPRPVNAAGQDDITSFAYDGSGNLLTMTNPLGHVTSYAGYDANGRPANMTDPNGLITQFAYDGLGRLVETRVKGAAGAASDAVTVLEYDIEGRIIGLTLPQTDKLLMAYDLAGQLKTISAPNGESISFAHDAMGNITQQQVKRTNGSAASTITRSFDSLGRLLSQTLGAGRTTRWSYDKNGNAVQTISARSDATTAAFDPLNRLVSTLAPDTGTSNSGYNQRDEMTSFTDAAAVTTSFVRNGFGEVIGETSPDRGTSTYYYDAAGDLQAVIDGRGQRVNYTRDILGRVLSATPQGLAAQTITYSYDVPALTGSRAVGRVSTIATGGVELRFSYDHRGNVVNKQQRLPGGSWVTLAVQYNLADRISQITYPSGRIVAYGYDPLGRVSTVRTKASAAITSWTNLATAMSYEPFAALKSANLGSGLKLLVSWGNDQRLASCRIYRNNGSDVWHSSYAYDANDNITAITDLVNPANSRSFVYDSMDRLTRVDGAQGSFGREDYVHDRNGNRLAIQRRVNVTDAAPANSESYTLASGTNRLASITAATGTRSFTHDARGNLTGDTRSPGGPNVTVSYDGHARLVSYTNASGDAQAMAYNGQDERVRVVTTPAGGAADTRMVFYDLDHRIIGEYGATGAADLKAEYIWLLPQVGASRPFGGDDGTGGYMPLAIAIGAGGSTSQIAWTHGNHLGTPMLTTDANGTALAPYGTALIGFPGQWRPATTIAGAEFYYNRYRDYDPSLGRYIQADPIGLAGGAAPYGYAGNNPLRFTDPQGLYGESVFDVGFIFYDLYRIGKDNVFGNSCPGVLTANLTALGLDVVGLIIPGATGLGAASRAGKSLGKYDVGSFANLKARSAVGDRLDIHHVIQKHPAGQVVKGYNPANGPSIALPLGEHRRLPTLKGDYSGSARDLLAADIRNLRNNTNAPNKALHDLIDLNKQMYPGALGK